ncbi:M55 family metallopeptidase [Elusimicrobiota bacterium]
MAKVFISADIEGVSGISNKQFTGPKCHGWDLGRSYMVEDVNAAIAGVLEAAPGSEIVVRDAHGGSDNIVLEKLHPGTRLVAGWPHSFDMLEGLDGSFDACLFIGYHSRSLVPGGVLAHTFSRLVRKVTLSGREVGESGINAFLAGGYGVPVAMISGDDKVAEEVAQLLPKTPVAVVKKGVARECCEMPPLTESRELIRRTAAEAIKAVGGMEPLRLPDPLDFRVRLSYAEALMGLAYLSDYDVVVRDSMIDVAIRGESPREVFERFSVLLRLSFSED